ncbi:MAG TPA: ABC transporter permease [Gemmatimonadales bacterium]
MKGAALAVRIFAGLAVGLVTAFLVLPVVALLLRVSPRGLLAELADPEVREALRLSLATSFAATALVVLLGLPLAWLLASARFPGKRILEVLVALPMVLPPTVAGLALLLAFGRAGLLGGAFSALGISIPFTTAAVVLAQMFVALPFFVGAAAAGIRGVSPLFGEVAATLGAPRWYAFLKVIVPLGLPGLVAGAAMGWARALGEFGATIIFAGNLAGVTRTMPLAVYVRFETDLESAVALSVTLLAVSFGVLLAVRTGPFGAPSDAVRAGR